MAEINNSSLMSTPTSTSSVPSSSNSLSSVDSKTQPHDITSLPAHLLLNLFYTSIHSIRAESVTTPFPPHFRYESDSKHNKDIEGVVNTFYLLFSYYSFFVYYSSQLWFFFLIMI